MSNREADVDAVAGHTESILELLHARGRRITTSRRAVIELLITTKEHLTVEQIAARVQSQHPEIHLSTVYRTLEVLEEWGVVEHIHRGHGAPVHHLAHAHPHLVCETCGRVYDIPAAELDALGTHLKERYGFELHATHFALMGQCNQHASR